MRTLIQVGIPYHVMSIRLKISQKFLFFENDGVYINLNELNVTVIYFIFAKEILKL